MTLLDVQNQIVGHFCLNEVFTHKDYEKIVVPEKMESVKTQLIEKSLEILTESKMISPLTISATGIGAKDQKEWILNEPLNSRGQTVTISMGLANSMAIIINSVLEARGIETRVNSLNITEGNVADLLTIIEDLTTESVAVAQKFVEYSKENPSGNGGVIIEKNEEGGNFGGKN